MSIKTAIKKFALNYLPYSIQFEVRKWHYLNKLQHAALEDEKELGVLQALVTPGTAVVDIGANFGLYTKFLSGLTGDGGAVYSIEPVPYTFAFLKNNILKLNLRNAIPLNFAISDKEEMMQMAIPRYTQGGDNLYEAKILEKGRLIPGSKEIRVKATTLDKILLDKVSRISFIKCDTEGHELFCFLGAAGILNRDRPNLLVEINEDFTDHQTHAYRLVSLLNGMGYKIYFFDGKNFCPCSAKTDSVNYVFSTMDL